MSDQAKDAADALDRVTARDAAADTAPILASDPRSLTVDRASTDTASPGANEDAAAAAERDAD